MQYSNRVNFRSQSVNNHQPVQQTASVNPASLLKKNENQLFLFKHLLCAYATNITPVTQPNHPHERKMMKFPHIIGKGTIIDEFV